MVSVEPIVDGFAYALLINAKFKVIIAGAEQKKIVANCLITTKLSQRQSTHGFRSLNTSAVYTELVVTFFKRKTVFDVPHRRYMF